MRSAAHNLALLNFTELSAPFWSQWDTNSNDADWCCEAAAGNRAQTVVIWGADDQGGSAWGRESLGCHASAAIATAAAGTLDQLLLSMFSGKSSSNRIHSIKWH
jgi:hypothetical protein